jgi:AsmA protein
VAPAPDSFDLLPVTLPLGGKQPATLEGHVDDTGYTLHLTGTVLCANLLELANAVPQFGEGLKELLDKIAPAAPAAAPPTPATSDSGQPAQSGTAPDPILTSDPIHIDVSATRAWGGAQTWNQTTPAAPSRHPRK